MRYFKKVFLVFFVFSTSALAILQSEPANNEETRFVNNDNSVDPMEKSAKEKVTISIGVYPNLGKHIYETVIPQFQDEHPNIEVTLKVLPFEGHHNSLIAALVTESGAPDVVALEIGFIAKFFANDGLDNLNQEPYNASELKLKDKFTDYAWQQGIDADERLLAIPADLSPGVMFWHRDIFKTFGADIDDVTKSWDNYIEFGRKIISDTNHDGQNNIFLIADAADVYQAIIRTGIEDGQSLYFGENGEVLVDSKRFVKALETAKTIRDLGLDAKIRPWSPEWLQGLRAGKVATQFSGAWFQNDLESIAPTTSGSWGVSNLPEGGYSIWGGSFYAIPEQSDHKEEAWELLKFLTLNENIQLCAAKTIAAFPALKSAWEKEKSVLNEPIEFLGGQKTKELYEGIINNIKNITTHPDEDFAEEVMWNALSQVLNYDHDVNEALVGAKERIELHVKRKY